MRIEEEGEEEQQQEPLALIETTARDLVTNPRLAALLLESFKKRTRETQNRYHWARSAPAFRGALFTVAQQCINDYIGMNGLSGFSRPDRLLLVSLASSMHRFPFLPETISLRTLCIEDRNARMQSMQHGQ